MRVDPNSSSGGNLHGYLAHQDLIAPQHPPALVVPSSPAHESQPILRQAASRVIAFSSQYGGEESAFAYTAQNLAGETRIYPRYGDCSHAAVFRTFDRWWSDRSLLWLDGEFDKGVDVSDLTEDFIALTYSTPVFLKAVEIYETFNVGHVVKIYAGYAASAEEPVQQWTLLWSGKPDSTLGKAARAFCPPLHLDRLNGQPVNAIRLELCSAGAEYYPELDAVYIHGYPMPNAVDKGQLCQQDLPFSSPSSNQSPTKMQSQAACFVIPQEDQELDSDTNDEATTTIKTIAAPRSVWSMFSVQQALNDLQRMTAKFPAVESSTANVSQITVPNLDSLPQELVLAIVEMLPRYDRSRTVARLALVCKRLWAAVRDPAVHSHVDLKPCWHAVDSALVEKLLSSEHLQSRDLRRLRVSWLPPTVDLTPLGQLQTSRLSTLLLGSCQQVTDSLLASICATQPCLQTLDLSSCRGISPGGFACLESLVQLRRLSLYRTLVAESVLVQVIQSLRQLESLDVGSLSKVTNMDAVLKCVAVACPRLRAIDCWRGKSLTHFGLRDLAQGCPLLEELDLGWCGDVRSSTGIFRHLAKSLPRLRRVLLTANRTISDGDLDAMATYLFDSLEHLDILGCRDVTANGVIALLDRCPRLAFLDISFCASLDFDEVAQLRKTFPRCAIKKSYQP